MSKFKFDLGQVVMTQGISEIVQSKPVPDLMAGSPGDGMDFNQYRKYIFSCLDRHRSGDWGLVPKEDAKENELSLEQGYRLLSSYYLDPNNPAEGKFWVITEADRSVTTILLPSEY